MTHGTYHRGEPIEPYDPRVERIDTVTYQVPYYHEGRTYIFHESVEYVIYRRHPSKSNRIAHRIMNSEPKKGIFGEDL